MGILVGQMRFRPFQWSQLDKLTTQLSDNPEDLIETDCRSGCATAVPHKQELWRTEIVVWSNGNLISAQLCPPLLLDQSQREG